MPRVQSSGVLQPQRPDESDADAPLPQASNAPQPDALTPAPAIAALVKGHDTAAGTQSAASRFVAIQKNPVATEPSLLDRVFPESKTEAAMRNVAIVAARLGLPTKVLEAALHRDAFGDTSDNASGNHISPLGDRVCLSPETSAAARDWSERSITGTSTQIGTVYHEAVHQYLLTQTTHQIRDFVEKGIESYAVANVDTRFPGQVEPTKNPESAFHEAVAEYAGHRIGAWVEAHAVLESFRQKGTLNAEHVALIAENYDDAMTRRVFGYEQTPWLDRIQGEAEHRSVRMRIPEAVRAFVDDVLLEGRISGHFQEDPTFRKYVAEAATTSP